MSGLAAPEPWLPSAAVACSRPGRVHSWPNYAVKRAFGRTQVHRLTTNVGQCQGFIQVLERQAESSQQAEVGNGRADWIGRQRVVSRQRSATGGQNGSAGRE